MQVESATSPTWAIDVTPVSGDCLAVRTAAEHRASAAYHQHPPSTNTERPCRCCPWRKCDSERVL